MTRDIKKKLTLIHLNKRNNGGNLVLRSFAKVWSVHEGYEMNELTLMSAKFQILKLLFSRKDMLLFSNPVLLVLFFYKKRGIYFIQSIEEELFGREDFNGILVWCYKIVISVCLRFSRNIKIFNSKFTENHYKHLKRKYGCYPVYNSLYFEKYKSRVNEASDKIERQCIWIGTRHKRKGFSDLVELAKNNANYNFICIFSGRYPDFKSLPQNIKIYSNLSPSNVHKLVSESEFSVITSSFESLCLPLYEGLLYGNQVIVKKADYIFTNGVGDYVHIFDKLEHIKIKSLPKIKPFLFKDPCNIQKNFFQKIRNEL